MIKYTQSKAAFERKSMPQNTRGKSPNKEKRHKKRLTSLVLALLLALTMMVGAFAETADVTGEWYGELLGIQVTLTINADGTYKMDIAGMDSEEGV